MLRLLSILLCSCLTRADYLHDRETILNNEQISAIGGTIRLTPREELVNKILMKAKKKELYRGFINPREFLPAKHFFQARKDILKSEVYGIIKKMPKGGALHVHDSAMGSTDYNIKNITYRDNLYVLLNNDSLSFKFSLDPPCNKWILLQKLRQKRPNIDAYIRTKLNLITEDPYKTYPDVNAVWKSFGKIFKTLGPLLRFRPVFEDYFYNALQEFYADNVNFVEVRGTLPELYELNGTTHDSIKVLGLLKNVAHRFLMKHPDFIGIKYIYAPNRNKTNEMTKFIQKYKTLKKLYGDFLAGFDLVGQEDCGQPLSSYLDQLLPIASIAKFYFHAGETNWNGMSTDNNLIDAILLNVTRIGHGYAVVKHPVVLKYIKQRGIAIEINPISNQVLNLVKDMRNHPANILISQNYPIVISSDDPGLWSANGLSFDFYETFMGMANSKADLRLLKQLALNSITYSSKNKIEKQSAVTKFNKEWNKFINEFLKPKISVTNE